MKFRKHINSSCKFCLFLKALQNKRIKFVLNSTHLFSPLLVLSDHFRKKIKREFQLECEQIQFLVRCWDSVLLLASKFHSKFEL